MKPLTLLVPSLLTLASGTPLEQQQAAPHPKGTFQVQNFQFSNGNYLFNVTIPYAAPNHRPVTNPSQCQGTTYSTYYVDCTYAGYEQYVRAYINNTNLSKNPKAAPIWRLYLEYQDSYPANNTYYLYTGDARVRETKTMGRDFAVPESKESSGKLVCGEECG